MQAAFAAALLDPERAPPPGLAAVDTTERFAIYRNNVVNGLGRALAAGFPATAAIVGTEFFAAMAAVFVRRSPPTSPVLLHYGAALPDFIAGFAPAASVPYLADVARLELAYTRVFHAADAEALPADALRSLNPETLGMLRLALHPAMAILRSQHPVATIWAMNSGRAALGEIADWQNQDVLVLRPKLTVAVSLLAPGEAIFLRHLQAGRPLAMAAAAASDNATAFDLGAALAAAFSRGTVIAMDISREDDQT